MNEKLDLTKILKDCPKGMPLDCAMFDDVTFTGVEKNKPNKPISIRAGEIYYYLTEFGTWSYDKNAKCVIFPKGKTTWEGFQRPFVDGDVVTDIEGAVIIYREITISGYCGSFASLDHRNQFVPHYKSYLDYIRLATEEEKQKLFDVIKENGYKWNAETKTLEKLKKEKFDPKTLQTFDKVLVRHRNDNTWYAGFFSNYNKVGGYAVCTGGVHYSYCIPYNEDTKHLVGKMEEAPEFYRYWEK